MTTPEKKPPSVEQSIKYIAWDIKKIGESVVYLKEIADQLKLLASCHCHDCKIAPQPRVEAPPEDSDTPF